MALALKGPLFAHQWFPLSSCLAQLAVFCAFLIPAGQVFSEVFEASFCGAAEASLRHCLQRQWTVPFPVAGDLDPTFAADNNMLSVSTSG